jgi:hypothetical protein
MTSTPDPAWLRLGELLQRRRAEIDTRYTNLALFAEERGIAYRVAWDIEHGRRENFRTPTKRAIEVAYHWPAGTIDRVLAGGEPTTGAAGLQAWAYPLERWEQLGHALQLRRTRIRPRYALDEQRRFARDHRSLVSPQTVRGLEAGEPRDYPPSEIAGAEIAYQLHPGNIGRYLEGGSLEPLPEPGAEPAPSLDDHAPLPADPQLRALILSDKRLQAIWDVPGFSEAARAGMIGVALQWRAAAEDQAGQAGLEQAAPGNGPAASRAG